MCIHLCALFTTSSTRESYRRTMWKQRLTPLNLSQHFAFAGVAKLSSPCHVSGTVVQVPDSYHLWNSQNIPWLSGDALQEGVEHDCALGWLFVPWNMYWWFTDTHPEGSIEQLTVRCFGIAGHFLAASQVKSRQVTSRLSKVVSFLSIYPQIHKLV